MESLLPEAPRLRTRRRRGPGREIPHSCASAFHSATYWTFPGSSTARITTRITSTIAHGVAIHSVRVCQS